MRRLHVQRKTILGRISSPHPHHKRRDRSARDFSWTTPTRGDSSERRRPRTRARPEVRTLAWTWRTRPDDRPVHCRRERPPWYRFRQAMPYGSADTRRMFRLGRRRQSRDLGRLSPRDLGLHRAPGARSALLLRCYDDPMCGATCTKKQSNERIDEAYRFIVVRTRFRRAEQHIHKKIIIINVQSAYKTIKVWSRRIHEAYGKKLAVTEPLPVDMKRRNRLWRLAVNRERRLNVKYTVNNEFRLCFLDFNKLLLLFYKRLLSLNRIFYKRPVSLNRIRAFGKKIDFIFTDAWNTQNIYTRSCTHTQMHKRSL